MKKYPLALLSALLCATFTSVIRAEDAELLKPDQLIKIPNSKGKFDFLEVDAVNNRLLAAHEKAGTADFIDLATNTVITRLATGPAVHVALDAKTGEYFISASEDKKVLVVDAKTLKQVGEIPTEGELDALLYEPVNDRIYITNDEGTHVWSIDPNSRKIVADIPIPSAPEYMLYDATTDRIYLNLKKENRVDVIDPKTDTVIAHWSTLPAENPHGLAFDPATGHIFPAGQNGIVSSIDTKTGMVVGSAEIEKGVDQAVFDPSTRRIYCATGPFLSIVKETKSGLKAVGKVATPKTAKNVAINPADHSVWTTYTEGDDSYAKSWLPPAK